MKIVHKINLANISVIILIALTGFFAYQNINLVLTKLRFTEIADGLNASFLEMRLSEKNFFLYRDTWPSPRSALKSTRAWQPFAPPPPPPHILTPPPPANFEELKACLEPYRIEVDAARGKASQNTETQAGLRETGQQLREFPPYFSTVKETRSTGSSTLQEQLFTSLCLILITAIGLRYLTFFNILKSLKQIKKVVSSISEGDFRTIETEVPKDELGSVMTAITTMSKELEEQGGTDPSSQRNSPLSGYSPQASPMNWAIPLNNISMIAQTYMEIYENLSKEDRIDFMVKIEEETRRIKHIVDNLLDFSRPKKIPEHGFGHQQRRYAKFQAGAEYDPCLQC